MTKEQILEAINDYFGDTSRSRDETRDGLDEISEHAASLVNTLDDE